MHFDPSNPIVQLCAEGMNQPAENARSLFQQAWNESATDLEKFIAAHYLARVQPTVEDKLKWDQTALQFAQAINDDSVQEAFPSLYLNIGKCHEDLGDLAEAKRNYELAESFSGRLPNDGYGAMVRAGITDGLKRVTGN